MVRETDRSWLEPLHRPIVAVAAFSLVVNVLLLAPALYMLQVFDRVLASGSRETLWVLLAGTALALLFAMALDYLRGRLQGVMGNMLGDRLMPQAVAHVVTRRGQGLGSKGGEPLRDVATVRGLFSAPALLAVCDAPWVLVYLAVIWLAHPALGTAAALAAVFMLGLAWFNDAFTRRHVEQLQWRAGRAQRSVEASVQNAEVAQAMGMTECLTQRWHVMNGDIRELQRRTAQRTVALAAFTRLTRQAVQTIILTVGAYLVITQAATAGVMVATTILLGRALAPVEQLVGSWRLLVEGRAALRRLREALTKGEDFAPPLRLPAPNGALTAEGLLVRAPDHDQIILANVSFALQAGESLAILGASGAGKSTLMRVLAGLWRPVAGTVRLDGADVGQWPREQLGPFIGYVPQDVELFDATVAENIARLQEPDPDRVVEAAQKAGIHEMVLALTKGYDTLVDPQGTLLSPGQRQRIAIARALYGAPRLVLLDEPNSNLDGAGEQQLGVALNGLRGQATVVLITHRTTLVQQVDKLLVLEAGRLRHFGPTAEVLRAMQAGAGRVVPMHRPAGEVAG